MKIDAKGLLVSACVMLAVTSPALAQTADQMKVAYNGARNQLGVVKYCQEKGFADAETVTTQQKMLGLIPKPADARKVMRPRLSARRAPSRRWARPRT